MYTQTPPPGLDERSHLIMEKPEILIPLSSIPSCKKVSHRHKNRVDLSHKSDNISLFLLVRVMRRATFINIKIYIEGRRVILLSFIESCKWGLVEVESLLMGAMYGLLDFESERNSFAVIGSFAFSVPLAVL